MGNEYGVIGATLLGLGAIARFIWRWEKTFTDSAIDELKRIRNELDELRNRNNVLEEELIRLRRGSGSL